MTASRTDGHWQQVVRTDRSNKKVSATHDDVWCTIENLKIGNLKKSLVLLGVTSLWHMAQWVFCAPPNHILPAFSNLKGSISKILVDPDDGNSNEIVYYEKRGDSRIPFESYHSIPLMRIKDMLYQLDPQ